jgi:hypothetical protein
MGQGHVHTNGDLNTDDGLLTWARTPTSPANSVGPSGRRRSESVQNAVRHSKKGLSRHGDHSWLLSSDTMRLHAEGCASRTEHAVAHRVPFCLQRGVVHFALLLLPRRVFTEAVRRRPLEFR